MQIVSLLWRVRKNITHDHHASHMLVNLYYLVTPPFSDGDCLIQVQQCFSSFFSLMPVQWTSTIKISRPLTLMQLSFFIHVQHYKITYKKKGNHNNDHITITITITITLKNCFANQNSYMKIKCQSMCNPPQRLSHDIKRNVKQEMKLKQK